ncbi:MAG TPA: substrate-binding domain-containing protein [Cytophagales bacterium]
MTPTCFHRFVLLLALLLLLAHCTGNGGKASEDKGRPLRIAVIPKGTTHHYWKSVRAGALRAAQELGVEVIWQGPPKEDDRQMQIQVVQNFISQDVAAIVLAPLDAEALVPPVVAARNRRIPVVIIDSGLHSDAYASYIATDNAQGGRLCARRLAGVMGGRGNVLVLPYLEGSASTTEREAGFLAEIKNYPGIRVLTAGQYAGATMEKALQTAQNLLNRYPETEGVFCSTQPTTQAMLRALEVAGKKGVKLVGFDLNDVLLQAVRKGDVAGLALQDPFRMGYEGVRTGVAIAQGKPYPKKLDTGVKMITPENVDDPDQAQLLKLQVNQ